MGKNGFLKNFKKRPRLEKLVISVGAVFCLLAVLSIASVATTLPRFIVGSCVYVGIVAVIINIILKKIRTPHRNRANSDASGLPCVSESTEFIQRKTKNKAVRVLVVAWVVYVVVSVLSVPVCVFLGGYGARMMSSRIQLPLGGVDSIAVDSMGRVYCGIPFYSRIQVYSKEGDFLQGWFVPDAVMVLEVDTNDLLHYLACRKRHTLHL